MTEYEYINLYIDPAAQLVQVQAILAAFDTLTLDLISKGAIKEYFLDDGQVVIKRSYGSLREIAESRLTYEQFGNRLIAQIEGRATKFLQCSE